MASDSPLKAIEIHNKLVHYLGERIVETKFLKLKNLFKDIPFTPVAIDSIKNMFDLFECLKTHTIIAVGDYSKFLDQLRITNPDLVKYVITQENEIKEIQGSSGDRDPGVDAELRNEKKRNGGEDRTYQFRKQIDNTHDARIIDVWTRARNAVGRIKGPLYTGTGIRVGSKYILTAYHVAKDITKENTSDTEDWSKLGSEHVWIEFHFPKKIAEKFRFIPERPVYDEKLDFAILELQPGQSAIPQPIRKFGKPDYSQSFALLGHPGKPKSEIMQFDSDIELFDLNADKNSSRRGYMIANDQVKTGYEEIRDQGKVLFDCWVQHGASGSPGIVMGNADEEPICTLMLVRGFPSQAFSENVDVPHEQMIEQGVTMEAIANKTNSLGESAKRLKIDIFGKNFP
ncbi:uncharacterized protein LOC110441084 [Mizuhopecten yessoensis]|uniref:uncharacterized protein LOC110441084 n=1 Tax=Mizuhopecten yessoensis TaxID=6573 RepID=UPI000B45B332|nr:uncharacterized protein LOC110441084 [Mizuhopecten yessoensis]XP_021339869.1 uncharacterized protein LOC110441084 [Mizuhopecten yessoensis]